MGGPTGRGRAGFALALAGSVALAFLVVAACHPSFAASATDGMSAPLTPASSIESAPGTQLPQLQFDSHGLAARTDNLSLVFVAIWTNGDASEHAGTASPHYGPLYRRPPPSLS
jgi:hypothetical protein